MGKEERENNRLDFNSETTCVAFKNIIFLKVIRDWQFLP